MPDSETAIYRAISPPMTAQELTQYFELKKKLEDEEEMLMSLEAAAYPRPILDGMPHTPGFKDRVGDLVAEIADIKEHICSLRGEVERKEKRVTAFIDSIGDPYIRTIFRLRFIRCMTWKEVAGTIGGRNTSDAVRMVYCRYMDKCSQRK